MIYLIDPQEVVINGCILKKPFCSPKFVPLYGVDPTI
jgi:hypothetical protein